VVDEWLKSVGLMRSKKEKGKKTKSLFSGRMVF